MILHI